MNWVSVAWILFSIPGSIVITFIGLFFSAQATYQLNEVIIILPRPAENDSVGLRWTLARWRRIIRLVRRRNWSRGLRIAGDTTLLLAGATVASALVGLMAAIAALIPFVVARDTIGLPAEDSHGIPLLPLLLGPLLGVFSLFRSIHYLSTPGRKRTWGGLPRISFVAGDVSWTRRTGFLRKVYRHHQLRFAVNASTLLGVLSLATGSAPADEHPRPAGSAHTWTVADAYDSLWLGGLALGLATRWLLLAASILLIPRWDRSAPFTASSTRQVGERRVFAQIPSPIPLESNVRS